MLLLFGYIAITAGTFNDNLCTTESNVSLVAVAVNAITLTWLGIRLHISPIHEKATLNWSPKFSCSGLRPLQLPLISPDTDLTLTFSNTVCFQSSFQVL